MKSAANALKYLNDYTYIALWYRKTKSPHSY